MLTTRELKTAYRKGIARLHHEQDPLRRHLLLQMTLAIKMDLARRYGRFGGKLPIWKRIVRAIPLYKKLNEPYVADAGGNSRPSIGGPK